jgi:glycosyltransferase involved in cell wall biosynthesis
MIYFINKNKRRPYTREEEVWLNQTRQKAPDAIAVMHPQWRGIRSSTENLFDCCLYVGDSVDDFENLDVFASLLLESGCSKIVFSGFAKSFGPLALHLKKTNSTLLLYCLWHGNFMQSNEEYNWEQFKLVLQMTRAHTIHKWGFVKEGMAEMMEKKFGIKTAFVKNYVKHIPTSASTIEGTERKLGIWAISSNWRKNPYAMLVACSVVPQSKVFCFGHDSKIKDFISTFGIHAYCQENPVPQAEMPKMLASMHLNLYVTLSECTPMTPLESLAAGVPCLVGPTSHLFKTNEYLFNRLVVPYPDKSSSILKHIDLCLADRIRIIEEYIVYATAYAKEAKESVTHFLN